MANIINGHYLPGFAPEFGVHRWHCGVMSKIHVETVELETGPLSCAHCTGQVGSGDGQKWEGISALLIFKSWGPLL